MGSDESRRNIIRELEAAGWRFLRSGGDHDIYGCPCGRHIAPVPRHRTIKAGVVANIRRAIANCKKGA